MSDPNKFLSTQEFAKQAGVSASTISKWLRSNKLNGHKQGGKWMIPAAEILRISQSKPSDTAKPSAPESKNINKPIKTKSNAKAYSIKEFSAMTYLTEYGVQKWSKDGRLSGSVEDGSGNPMVDAASLENSAVKRLLRG